MIDRIVQTFILSALVAVLAACGSEPTSTVCTRADLGGACSEPSSAEQLADVEVTLDGYEPRWFQRWHVTLRTTVTDWIEYDEDGHLCVLTETQCITEECDLPEMFGLTFANADEAIESCRRWYGR